MSGKTPLFYVNAVSPRIGDISVMELVPSQAKQKEELGRQIAERENRIAQQFKRPYPDTPFDQLGPDRRREVSAWELENPEYAIARMQEVVPLINAFDSIRGNQLRLRGFGDIVRVGDFLRDIPKGVEVIQQDEDMRDTGERPHVHGTCVQVDEAKLIKEIASLKQRLKANPNDVEALHSMGRFHQEWGEPDAALGYYQRVLENDKKHSTTWFHMGIISDRRGDYQKAVGYFTRFVELNMDDYVGWNRLGLAYYSAGDEVNGKRCNDMALKLRPRPEVVD